MTLAGWQMADGISVDVGTPARLLCVFAHPDDEQWGTAGALLACVERGIEVHLLTATSGEAGEISDPALATPATLAAVREEELRTACRMLGLQPPILLRHPDGHLDQVDGAFLVGQIAAEIRRLRPRVVLTFDANGGYGHPDHIAAHHATLRAVELAADPADCSLVGAAPHRIDKLYGTAYPRSVFASLEAGLAAAGFPPVDFGSVQTIGPEELGTPDEWVTTAVPVDRFFERRWASLLAHRTQYGPDNPFVAVGTETARRWLQTDYFRRISPAPSAALPDEDDLWAGLPTPEAAGESEAWRPCRRSIPRPSWPSSASATPSLSCRSRRG
jgi:LmbE family N-acetylglucosaminyl deacetylase